MAPLHRFVFLLLSFLASFSLLVSVHAQSQSGFISIDCGLPGNSTNPEPITGLIYVADSSYVDTGETVTVSDDYMTDTLLKQLATARTFPNGSRNCYNVDVVLGTRYLIRASFLYANFDGTNTTPTDFDLYLGPNYWATVSLQTVASILHEEIIHISTSSTAQVCLVKTGPATPFISSLEFRPINNVTYSGFTQTLKLFLRLDLGSNSAMVYRFPNDTHDRNWFPKPSLLDWIAINGSSDITVADDRGYDAPRVVLSTAFTVSESTSAMSFGFTPATSDTQYGVYMYFAELVQLESNQSRSFDIYLNGAPVLSQSFSPSYLREGVAYSTNPMSNSSFVFSLNKTENSTLPPILNAIEIYSILGLPQSATDQQDVDAITSIKSTYGISRNWEGDPCAPKQYAWSGLVCNYGSTNSSPTITSLVLSSSGLTGSISLDILNLRMLDTLDLSNNKLTGSIPDFLSQLPLLKVLNLENNNLSGSIPASLLQSSNNGSLTVSLGGNPNLSSTSTTPTPSIGKKSNVVVPVVASIAGVVVVVLLLVAGIIFWKRRGRVQRGAAAGRVEGDRTNNQTEPWEMQRHQYSYSKVVKMTSNFKRVLGEGGFGKVYYGQIESSDTEVAIKMLSESSSQGYQQFQAEVELLMRVHHRNLISLVGYCNEGPQMGLIYEYMSRGNLGSLLTGETASSLTWERRLHIALDAAQGLEYMHNGCRPAMVHRDIKCSNILLNDILQAKLADFGLSRSFPTEGGATHITTNVIGTPGYLDPEYYVSYRLNEKSDVYSFGIVILELVTGRPVLVKTHEKSHITQWVEYMLIQGDISSIIDSRMKNDYDVNSIWKAVEVAMSSASHISARRPAMSEVVKELKESLDIELDHKAGSQTQDTASFDTGMASQFRPVAR